jgi:hypothetical protein
VSGWHPPRHATVIGAAHRRRGVVCQDASGVAVLPARQGGSLQVLVVADGHGGQRYSRSAVGSRLACDEARAAVAAALNQTPLDDQAAWRALLRQGLPAAIQQRWGEAVQAHWHTQPTESSFDASLYGTTLGVLLLAPGWWGCTGLGDWDLVQVGPGEPALLNEEVLPQSSGEATASLCLAGAADLWSRRARLEPLPAAGAPFSLVLSTDGVRKSCATDRDFLELCSQIAAVQEPEELNRGLAEITNNGSGDDLSVAIGHWAGLGGPGGPGLHADRATDLPLSAERRPAARRAGVHPALMTSLSLALAAAAWVHGPPLAQRVSTAWRVEQIRRQAEQLCRTPAWITPILNQRRAQFEQLRSGRLDRQRQIAAAGRDPLGALIAWSQPAIPLGHPEIPGTVNRPIAPPGSCLALDTALAEQWAQAPPTPSSAPSANPQETVRSLRGAAGSPSR